MYNIKDDTYSMDSDFPMNINKTWMRRQEYMFPYYHKHDFYEVSCVMKGSGTMTVGGKRYALEPGDVVILHRNEIHGWQITDDLLLFVLSFKSELIFDKVSLFDYEYLRFFEEKGNHFINKINHDEIYAGKIYHVMEDIYNEWIHEEIGRRMMMKSYVLRILTMLTRHYKNTSKSLESDIVQNKQMERLATVINYIREHYGEKITLEQAASKAYMSTTYFSVFFKRTMGENFSEYLIRFRIYKACEMLKSQKCSVLEAAHSCGFNNLSNFYRAYKKIMGKTPGNT